MAKRIHLLLLTIQIATELTIVALTLMSDDQKQLQNWNHMLNIEAELKWFFFWKSNSISQLCHLLEFQTIPIVIMSLMIPNSMPLKLIFYEAPTKIMITPTWTFMKNQHVYNSLKPNIYNCTHTHTYEHWAVIWTLNIIPSSGF
jgi:hypothetical protein